MTLLRLSLRQRPCRLAMALVMSTAPLTLLSIPATAATGKVADSVEMSTVSAIELDVDLTDTRRRIVRVKERIPVGRSGTLTLLYPQWETASHAPSISAYRLAGLTLTAAGRKLPWRRNPAHPHRFDIDLPAGARHVDAQFQFLAPLGRDPSGILMDGIAGLAWNRVLLYPAGAPTQSLWVQPQVWLPPGMTAATALDGQQAGDVVRFKPVALDQLMDSPLLAARHIAVRPIPGGKAPVTARWIARDAESIAQAEDMDASLSAVVQETEAVFGPPPFARYDYLLGLDDRLPGPGGIEHASSSEVYLPNDFLANRSAALPYVDLIPHELIHAWNGAWRMPKDTQAPTPNDAFTGTLLWVYEGQTEFWSRILAARAGLRTGQDTLDALALDAAITDQRPRRQWKSLADSANDPLIQNGPPTWRDWQGREDYYVEGVLFWLDIDAQLRRCSAGAKGMDDFARLFFSTAGRATGQRHRPYTEADVVKTLNAVCAAPWGQRLRHKLDANDDAQVLDGLRAHGWQLVFKPEPTPYFLASEAFDGVADLSWSIGLSASGSGSVKSVAWEGPAFMAGLVPGAKLIRVNGAPFSLQALRDAVAQTRVAPRVALVALIDGREVPVDIQYSGGHRYPALERLPDTPETLEALLKPRVVAKP